MGSAPGIRYWRRCVLPRPRLYYNTEDFPHDLREYRQNYLQIYQQGSHGTTLFSLLFSPRCSSSRVCVKKNRVGNWYSSFPKSIFLFFCLAVSSALVANIDTRTRRLFCADALFRPKRSVQSYSARFSKTVRIIPFDAPTQGLWKTTQRTDNDRHHCLLCPREKKRYASATSFT